LACPAEGNKNANNSRDENVLESIIFEMNYSWVQAIFFQMSNGYRVESIGAWSANSSISIFYCFIFFYANLCKRKALL